MATAKQIKYRLGQAKKKLTKVTRELNAAKANAKKLEGLLKKAQAAAKKKPKKKKAAPKRRKKKVVRRKKKAAKRRRRR